jgi:hypothetical protein
MSTASCPPAERAGSPAGRTSKTASGAATDAATSPPSSARWNRSQAVDLRQRPLATIVQRVHTEGVTRQARLAWPTLTSVVTTATPDVLTPYAS